MIVYVDVLFGVNFMLNYLCFTAVSKASYLPVKWQRNLLASFVGSLYAVFLFERSLWFLYSFLGKLLMSALLIWIAFGSGNKKRFFKLLCYYYVVSFAFFGAATFANYMTGEIAVKNGIFYYENNLLILLTATLFSYFLITAVLKLCKRSYKRDTEKREILIGIEGKTMVLTGLLDTGNSLLDPITLYPVIVVEYDRVKEILPLELKEFLKEGTSLNSNMNRRYLSKIRLIPYDCVGSHSILKGFKPDFVRLDLGSQKTVKDVIVAVVYKKLSPNNEYSAILNPQY